jgi:hypothetical protein
MGQSALPSGMQATPTAQVFELIEIVFTTCAAGTGFFCPCNNGWGSLKI